MAMGSILDALVQVDVGLWEAVTPTPEPWAALETPRRASTKAASQRRITVELMGGTPGSAHALAYQRWLDGGEALRERVLAGLFAHYQKTRADWTARKVPQAAAMPALTEPHQLTAMLDLNTVVLHGELEDGIAYLGLQLGASWDREHGVGVMLFGDEIVRVGPTAAYDAIRTKRPRAPAAKKAKPVAQKAKPVAQKAKPAAKKAKPAAKKAARRAR